MKLSDPTEGVSAAASDAVERSALERHCRIWEQLVRAGMAGATGGDQQGDGAASVDATVRVLADLAGPRGRVLEVGCGAGAVVEALAALRDGDGEPRFEVHGLEVTTGLLDDLRARVGDRANVELHLGNGYDLGDLDDDSFDLVYTDAFVAHLPKSVALNLFKEMHRVLRLGGRLRLRVPNVLLEHSLMTFNHFSQPHFAHQPFPISYYGPFEIVRLLGFAGFWVLDVDEDMVVTAAKAGRPGGPRELGRRLADRAATLAGLA